MTDVFRSVLGGDTFLKVQPTSMPIEPDRNQVEVSVRPSREQFRTQTSRTSATIDHGESIISADAHVGTILCGIGCDHDPEIGREK